LVELVADRERKVHLVEGGLAEALVPHDVEGQSGVRDAVAPFDRGDDFLGVGHLGDAGRIDEADGLDPRYARGGEAVNELCPGRGVENLRVVLEPVTGADVAYRHVAHNTRSSVKASISSSESPSSPP
jgi:hypothetical protein